MHTIFKAFLQCMQSRFHHSNSLDRDGEITGERLALSDEEGSVVRALFAKEKFRVDAGNLSEIPDNNKIIFRKC